jgi:cell wall-associated NlpC family hydrolase
MHEDTLKYLLIPFQHLGREAASGVDCAGLVMLWYRNELGIRIPDLISEYPADIKGRDYFHEYHTELGFLPVSDPRKHDVVVTGIQGVATHCGVLLDSAWFLHMTRTGSAVHQYTTGYWLRQVMGYYRHRG